MTRTLGVEVALALLLTVACADPAPPAANQVLPVVHEAQPLSVSIDAWEPDLAVAPDGTVYVTAGRRDPVAEPAEDGLPFEQRQVIWRSLDGGTTWEGPWAVSADGRFQGDQRVVVDGNGTVHVSYMDVEKNSDGKWKGLLRLATSRDRGQTFSVQTAMGENVSDKPELAVSEDGRHIYMVLESHPGPSLVASHDGGETWGEPQIVVPVEDRDTHFWPTGLALAADGRLWFSVPSIPNDELQKGGPSTNTLHVFTSNDQGVSWHETDFGSSPWIKGGSIHDPDCRVKNALPGVAVDAVGRAYVAYLEGNAGEPYRLLLRSSADDGTTWSEPQPVSEAPRPASADDADHYYPMVAAAGDGQVCVVWVDDRTGLKGVWARCSGDAALSWGDELLLSNRPSETGDSSAEGFAVFYGDYGGVALTDDGRLHATWCSASNLDGPGTLWFNMVEHAVVRKSGNASSDGGNNVQDDD